MSPSVPAETLAKGFYSGAVGMASRRFHLLAQASTSYHLGFDSSRQHSKRLGGGEAVLFILTNALELGHLAAFWVNPFYNKIFVCVIQ